MTFAELETISGTDYQKAHTGSEIAKLGKIVGYHNPYMVGVHDAVEEVQKRCPVGWRASWADGNDDVPANKAVYRVGQVKVRSADSAFILYVYRASHETQTS